MEKPRYHFECEVAFADTDASGWVHFSKILTYVERAEHAFLRDQGLLVFDRAAGGWPRVKIACEYKRPLLLGEKIGVWLDLDHVGGSSLVWKFEIHKAEKILAARGEMVTVRVNGAGEVTGLSAHEREILEGKS